MRNVLLLISDLHYHFSARQLMLLAPRLPAGKVCVRVAVLGGNAPWVKMLRHAGLTVDVLGWSRPIDARPLFALRSLIRSFRPEAIHTWDLPALRTLLLSGGCGRARLVVSRALPAGRLPGWYDRVLLRRADCIVALGNHEAAQYRAAWVPEDRLVVGAPCILSEPAASAGSVLPGGESPGLPDLPAGARVILGIGPIRWLKGFRDAVWALDILNHVKDVHHLVLVGAAPDSKRVARFARCIGAMNRVHFTGPVAELGTWLRRADVVWVPTGTGGGVGAALEAMAAGRPVLASQRPALAEIVVNEQTGLLLPPGDKAAVARQTLRLLKDPDLARRMGEAGCRRAAEVFSPQQLVQRCLALYD